jgi:hypothetical protein
MSAGIELIEPQLLMLGDQALVLRGYERLKDDEGAFTVLQEWRCEISSLLAALIESRYRSAPCTKKGRGIAAAF